MSIMYMKLTSGDEILGDVVGGVPATASRFAVEEPLLMDYVSVNGEDDRKQQLVFLSRYSPFTTGIMLREADVVAINPVLPIVEEYYQRSLEYVRAKTDLVFQSGISRSTEFMKKLTSGKLVVEDADAEETEQAEEFSDFETSGTRH